MTAPSAAPVRRPAVMASGFPEPGRHLKQAYRELHIAASGAEEQVQALGDLLLLPRPWDPPTCTRPELRRELWQWLEQVVIWLNTQYVWDVPAIIPACWAHHPHLVHEIALLADQRRRAGTTLTSDALEEWHRYCLPAFVERMRTRVKTHCDEGHQSWPAKGRFARHVAEQATTDRGNTFQADLDALGTPGAQSEPGAPRLHVVDEGLLVDTDTGEVLDEHPT